MCCRCCVGVCAWIFVLRCGAVCGSVLWCFTMCCNAVWCGAVLCSVLQRIAAYCSVLQCVSVRCSLLQCVAVHCSALQCVAVRCSVLQCVYGCANGGAKSFVHICVDTYDFLCICHTHKYDKHVCHTRMCHTCSNCRTNPFADALRQAVCRPCLYRSYTQISHTRLRE